MLDPPLFIRLPKNSFSFIFSISNSILRVSIVICRLDQLLIIKLDQFPYFLCFFFFCIFNLKQYILAWCFE
ncbi:hypothetical protein HanRHA438_Chr01g0022151 [Helianthus annuus]|nr:hypothetical protein HanRHA438_Chr01g0022151 [Helianthus annuus]